MKVIILCGGEGVRLKNMLEPIPKAMVKIGYRPILWHVMKIFSKFGYNEFVLALGAGGEKIRDYFINYDMFANDVTIELGNPDSTVINSQNQEKEWKITFVDTGEKAGTGARLFRCKDFVEGDDFFVAYSDCLSDVSIPSLLKQHTESGKILTLTGIFPPFRYGEFVIQNNLPIKYNEISTLKSKEGLVNGGFMVANKQIFDYLKPFSECVLEQEVFENLVNNEKIDMYSHDGFWQCLDNDREYAILNDMYEKNQSRWLF